MEEGPFGWLACTTNLEGAHLNLVDLLARHCSHGVGNFDDCQRRSKTEHFRRLKSEQFQSI
jgi:hypothetical protein